MGFLVKSEKIQSTKNTSGDANGCYWEGDEYGGQCKPALRIDQSSLPYERSCWTAVNETECNAGCEWY